MIETAFAVAAVSGSCMLATVLCGLIVAALRRERPDLARIAAYAVISPIAIPIVGGSIVAITLPPLGVLLGAASLVLAWDPRPLATYYVVVGNYGYGLAVQVGLFWRP